MSTTPAPPPALETSTLIAGIAALTKRVENLERALADEIRRNALAEAKAAPMPDFRPSVPVSDANPVKRTTKLRAYPGWIVREYADGMFDATDGKGLSPGLNSFYEAVAHAKANR